MGKNTPVNTAEINRFAKSRDRLTLDTLINEARFLATGSKDNFVNKADRLVSIAEAVSKSITPYTPCKKGCNHCCYMAVEVTSFEADMIGRYLGRDKQDVGQDIQSGPPESIKDAQMRSVRKYTGQKCSLLGDDGKCTVYPVRPIACRTHHNLGFDESNCVVTYRPGVNKLEDLPTTPHLNLNEFQLYVALVMAQGKTTWADIREWFPKEETK